MNNNEAIIKKIEDIRGLPLRPDSHLYVRYPQNTIGEASSKEAKEYGRNQKERPAIAIIEVVLSINRKYATHVEPHIIRLEGTDLATFKQLEEKLTTYSREQFYNYWGHHDERKYEILTNLIKSINVLKNKYNINNDYMLMNKWAEEANIDKYDVDIIGCIKYIGLAAFQHLRMNFGVDTVKPDRQVKEVLKREFGFVGSDKKTIIEVERISKITGYSTIELDQIFVNYGSGYYKPESEAMDEKGKREVENTTKKIVFHKKDLDNKINSDNIIRFVNRFEIGNIYEIEDFINYMNVDIIYENGIYEKLYYLIENIKSVKNDIFKDQVNDIKIKKRGDKAFILELVHKIERSKENGKNAITIWLKTDDFDIDIRKRTNGRESVSDYNIDEIVDMFKARLKNITTRKDNDRY